MSPHYRTARTLERPPGSRFAWRALDDARATLFADGDGVECSIALARALAGGEPVDAELLAFDDAPRVLTHLLDAGSLAWWNDEEE